MREKEEEREGVGFISIIATLVAGFVRVARKRSTGEREIDGREKEKHEERERGRRERETGGEREKENIDIF